MCPASSPRLPVVVAAVALSLLPRPAQTQNTLTELTGREVPGLESVEVKDATVGDDYFASELPALQFPGADAVPQIAERDSALLGLAVAQTAVDDMSGAAAAAQAGLQLRPHGAAGPEDRVRHGPRRSRRAAGLR